MHHTCRAKNLRREARLARCRLAWFSVRTGSSPELPSTTGSFPITVNATDQFGQAGAQDFTIQVFPHGFKVTGTMATARNHHTATLLQNGKVLVAGGTDDTSAELYDPATETFSPTGSMTTPRTGDTDAPRSGPSTTLPTLLGSGKVLVTGGSNGTTFLSSAELYDPASGTFTSTGNMGSARTGHTATLLKTGKILVVGGNTGSATLDTAELYDPVSGTFTPPPAIWEATIRSNAVCITADDLQARLAISDASERRSKWLPTAVHVRLLAHHRIDNAVAGSSAETAR